MTKTTIPLAATLCGVTVLAALPASAADVRAELTPELIYGHCLAAGVGSETEGTFMLPGGRRITGTVLCTTEDVLASKGKPSRRRNDGDDDDEGDDND